MKGIEGSTLGRYELRRRIARGGMSEVYLGYDRRVRRRVAIKVLYGSDEPFVRRFEREALAVGTLSHDHILPLYDFGEQRPWYYLVMPYVEGGTLRDYLLKRGHFTLEEAGSFLEQIASALQHAHEQDVVHRDVKPSNILLRLDGYAYLGDFGLAKAKQEAESLTHSGAIVGTPEYMSPEQSNGSCDYRGDIYSLGIILYHMLTGQVPFTADSPVAILLKHIQLPPPPPQQFNSEITSAIEQVMLKALAKSPVDRYQEAHALSLAYNEALQQKHQLISIRAISPNSKELPVAIQKAEEQITAIHQEQSTTTSTESTPAVALPSANDVSPNVLTQHNHLRGIKPIRLFPLIPLVHLTPLAYTPLPSKQGKRSLRVVFVALLCLFLLLIPIALGLFWQAHASPYRQMSPLPTITTSQPWTTATAEAQATMQATLARQAQAYATAGITSGIGTGPVLYEDAMTSPGNGWLNDGKQCYFSSDGYHVYTAHIHTVAWCYTNQQRFSNVVITAQTQLLYGDIYGIVFRLQPYSKAFYVLELNSQSEYRFVRAQGNDPLNWLTLIDWTPSGALLSGYHQTNTLLIVAQSHQFSIYINRQLVINSYTDTAYGSGFIGFLVGSDSSRGTEAVFSQLWVFQK